MAAQIGSLYVSLTADFSQFQRNMRAAETTVQTTAAGMRRTVGLTANTITQFNRSMGQVRPSALIAAGRSFDTATSRANLLRGSVFALTAAFGGLGAALTTNVVARYFDTFTGLENQLRVVSTSSADLAANMSAVSEVANRSRASLGAVATLFSRLQRASPDSSITDTLRRVETINKALQLGGATAQEAASAAIQFSQAIASNRLQGEEMRAILETPLGLELARGLGVTIGEFRKLGTEGQLTADVLFGALDKIAGSIGEKFAQSTSTIDQALTVADNRLVAYAGSLNETYGITRTLIGGINAFSNNLDTLIPVLAAAGAALGTLFAARRAGGLAGTLLAPVTAMKALTAARREDLAAAREEVTVAKQFLTAQQANQAELAKRAQATPDDFATTASLKQYQRDLAAVQKADAAHLALIAKKTQNIDALAEINRKVSVGEVRASEQILSQMDKIEAARARQRAGLQDQIRAQTQLTAAMGMQATNVGKLGAVSAANRDLERAQKEQIKNIQQIAAEEARLATVTATMERERGSSFAAAAQQRAQVLMRERTLIEDIARSEADRNQLVRKLAGTRADISGQSGAAIASAMSEAETATNNAGRALSNAQERMAAFTRAATFSSLAVAGIATAGRSLISFLGGGWGVGLIAAVTALGYFASASAKAAAAEERFQEILKRRTQERAEAPGGGDEARAARIDLLRGNIKALNEELTDAQDGLNRILGPLQTAVDYATDPGLVLERGTDNGMGQFGALLDQLRAGTITFDDLIRKTETLGNVIPRDELAGLLGDLRNLGANTDVNRTLETIKQLRNEIGQAEGAAKRARDAISALGGDRQVAVRTPADLNADAAVRQRAAYAEATDQLQRMLRYQEMLALAADQYRLASTNLVTPLMLAARATELLKNETVQTREEAEELARKLFNLEGKVITTDIVLRVTPSFENIEELLRGVPADLNRALTERREYGRGQESMRDEVARQRARKKLILETQDEINKALNTPAKIERKADELLGDPAGIVRTRQEAMEFAKTLLDIEENNRLAAAAAREHSRDVNKLERDYQKFADLIAELREKASGSFLSELDREVLDFASKLRDGSEMMRQYTEAITSGDLSKAPAQLLEIRDALLQIAAADTWREIIDNYGSAADKTAQWAEEQEKLNILLQQGLITPDQANRAMADVIGAGDEYDTIVQKYGNAAQRSQKFADEQERLNYLVGRGMITSQQAGLAWADFVGQFQDTQWIDSTADALSGFVEEAVTDFDNIEDAFKNLVKALARIALQELVLNPFKDWFRSIVSQMYGGGATGAGTTGGGTGIVQNVAATVASGLQNSVDGFVKKGVGAVNAPALVGSGLQPVNNVAAYIRQAASARGIDPNIALRVARSEGLGEGIWQSNYVANGRRETSYGPYQLLRGGGLGDKFERTTGMSVSDPRGVYKQVDFALDEASKGGWGPWYGAAKVGVGKWDGLRGSSPMGIQASTVANQAVAASAQSASTAIDKMTTETIGATGGLGNFASSLLNFFPAAPSGGGGLGGLLGGLGGIFGKSSGFFGAGATAAAGMALSPQAWAAIMSGAGGLFHEGGTVGGGSNGVKFAGSFAGARRLHRGNMKGNEFKAILQSGEEVLSRRDRARTMATMRGLVDGAGNGGRANEIHIKVEGAQGNREIQQQIDIAINASMSKYDYQKKNGGSASDTHRYNHLKRQGRANG